MTPEILKIIRNYHKSYTIIIIQEIAKRFNITKDAALDLYNEYMNQSEVGQQIASLKSQIASYKRQVSDMELEIYERRQECT